LKIFVQLKYQNAIKENSYYDKFLIKTHVFGHKIKYDQNLYNNIKKYDDFIKFKILYFENFFENSYPDYEIKNKAFYSLIFSSNFLDIRFMSHPYVVSKRILNYLSFIKRLDKKSINIIKIHFFYLKHQIEYKLSTNHYLTNLNALFITSQILNIRKHYYKKLFFEEVLNQLNPDHIHEEISLSYHLDLLNDLILTSKIISKINLCIDLKDLQFLINLMKSNIYFFFINDSTYINFNDSVLDKKYYLNNFLPLNRNNITNNNKIILHQSGLLRFKSDNFIIYFKFRECLPAHNPGHSHSDTNSLLLFYNNNPVIVDKGIFSYHDRTRKLSRSSKYHNSPTINIHNYSDIWGKFRVGNRAKLMKFSNKTLNNIHFARSSFKFFYKKKEIVIIRIIKSSPNLIAIKDIIKSNNLGKNNYFETNIIFDSKIKVIKQSCNNLKLISGKDVLLLSSSQDFKIIKTFKFDNFYNKKITSCLRVRSKKKLTKYKIFKNN